MPSAPLRGTGDRENGDLQVKGIVTAVTLHTRIGSICAQIDPGSKMNSRWVVPRGDGNIEHQPPGDFSTDVDVDTGDGNVRLGFPSLEWWRTAMGLVLELIRTAQKS